MNNKKVSNVISVYKKKIRYKYISESRVRRGLLQIRHHLQKYTASQPSSIA